MVRPPDPFWAYAEEMNDGCKKCKFCEHIYTRGTSISRVKCHLSGLRWRGVKICETVPRAVQEAARAAIDGPPEKKLKAAVSSSNNEADDITIPASLVEQNNEAENGMTCHSPGSALKWLQMHIEEIQFHNERTSPGDLMVDPAETTVRTAQVGQEFETTYDISSLLMKDGDMSNNLENATMGLMQLVEGGGFLQRLAVDEDGQPAYLEEMHSQFSTTSQPTDLEFQLVEMDFNQICSSYGIDDAFKNDEENVTKEPEQTFILHGSHEELQRIAGENRGDAPKPKLVGGGFGKNINVIWSWLTNNEVSFIGIYGMGGVGKTTLVKHIYYQLLDGPDTCHHVYWITVTQDFSIYRLQNLIAKCIGLDLSNEDEMHRPAKLLKALVEKQNCVLILDDLWNHFEPEKVGIPSKMNGCKLMLTTRSLDVCRRMGCEGNVIKVEPLSKEEAWNLFTMELGNYDIKLEPLAKAVAGECDGLPLGIRTMARSMRGVYDLCEWRNALEELKESNVSQSDMEIEVFRILKFSYLHLKDSALQQCFLSCALFPEDFVIKRVDLIEFLIDERIIEGRKCRRAEFDKGHEMLNRLENACLLESVIFEGKSAVKMHDLVRDMALQEMRENSQVMAEAGDQLEEIPDVEKWTQNLVRVSLMLNFIKEVPSSYSPRCPNVSTLLLSRNFELKFIGDSFFKQFHKLEVLDLSHTGIQKLPNSIFDLASLTVLLLGMCYDLSYLPSLAKLKALKKLDLHCTALHEVPLGLELLTSLKYLNLSGTRIQWFPRGILPKLYHLQVLRLGMKMTVEAKELESLRKLETLECHFNDLLDFNTYLKSPKGFHLLSAMDFDIERHLPSTYKFLIGEMNLSIGEFAFNFYQPKEDFSKSVHLRVSNIKSCVDAMVLPKGIQRLGIEACSDMRSLCDFYPLEHATELKSLSLRGCCLMECLFSFSQTSLSVLGKVEALHLHHLEKLCSFYSKDGAAAAPLPCNGMFSHLKILQVTFCLKMKVLFPPALLPNLQNLDVIEVEDCLNLEKIIGTEESNISNNNYHATEFCLPKLRILKLTNLIKLRSIGCGKLVCNSLQEISLQGCWSLERLPFSCSPLTLKVIHASPKEWWESVKWDEKHGYGVSHCLEAEFQNNQLQVLKGINHLFRGIDQFKKAHEVSVRRLQSSYERQCRAFGGLNLNRIS